MTENKATKKTTRKSSDVSYDAGVKFDVSKVEVLDIYGSQDTGQVRYDRENNLRKVYAQVRARDVIDVIKSKMFDDDKIVLRCVARGWRHIGLAGQVKEMLVKYEKELLDVIVVDYIDKTNDPEVPDELEFVVVRGGYVK